VGPQENALRTGGLLESANDELVQFGWYQQSRKSGDQPSIPPEQKGRRQGGYRPKGGLPLPDSIIRHQKGKRETVLQSERLQHFCAFEVHSNRYDSKSVPSVLPLLLLQKGKLPNARETPGRQEGHQENLAGQLRV